MTAFPNSHPEGSGMCHIVLSLNVHHQQRILGFVNRTVLQLLTMLQYFGICDHQMHPQRADKMKVTWPQGKAVRMTFESLPSKLLQQCFLLSGCIGLWHKVTLLFSPGWRSIVVVTDAQLVQKFKKLSHSGSISNSQNSMLKAYIYW